ncbi:MAG: YbaB/EbfC family nucleoid-associated protein [Epsilonproteobacteria bacterium]|nr:YbaB/EbfC family nucleoid-associated protein [Campylobacterota bacterium]
MFDFGELSKKLMEFQEKAKELEKEREKKIFTAKSGGGMVKVSANGKGEIIDLEIDDSLLEDKESLEILLISALNDVIKMVEQDKQRAVFDIMDPSLFGKK